MSDPPEHLEEIAGQCLERMQAEGAPALDDFCRAHPRLARQLRQLVAQLDSIGILEHPREQLPHRLGDYRILERLGAGGMGEVFLAEQLTLPRRVALKVMRPGFRADTTGRARFRREVAALSRLDHPGLCTIYEAGEFDGRPYLAMQLIDGETLAVALDRRRAAEREQRPTPSNADLHADLELVEKLARAVHAAHEAGFVHRDLKPGNVMVDRDGNPIVLDFGLVLADGDRVDHLTRSGEVLGTPTYMAPEQVRGDSAAVDRRTDVYALGVILFECLTLRPPFDARSRDALYRQILTEPPPDPRRDNRRVGGELHTVLQVALEKAPGRRFDSALQLADELRRIRTNVPILTRPPGAGVRLLRWCQRHRLVTGVAATAAAGLVVAVALLLWVARALTRVDARTYAAISADVAPRDAELSFKFAREALRLEDPPTPDAIARVQEAMFRLRWSRELAADDGALFHRILWSPDGAYLALLSFAEDSKSRLFEADGTLVAELPAAVVAAFHQDSTRLAVGGLEGTVHLYDLRTRPLTPRTLEVPKGLSPNWVYGLSYAPDGGDRLLVSDYGMRAVLLGPDGYGPVFGGDPKLKQVWTSAFLPDGRIVAGGGLWSPDGREKLADLGDAVEPAADWDAIEFIWVGADRFLTKSTRGRLRIFDHAGRSCGAPDHPTWPVELDYAALSPDGTRILTTTRRGRVELRDRDGAQLWSVTSPGCRSVSRAGFLPDGRGIVAGDWGGNVQRWTMDGMPTAPDLAHRGDIRWVAASPCSGDRIAVTHFYRARLWDLGRGMKTPIVRGLERPALAVRPGTRDAVVVASADGRVLLLDTDGTVRGTQQATAEGQHFVQFAPDGETAVIVGATGDVLRWSPATGVVDRWSFGGACAGPPAVLADGSIAVITRHRECLLWRPATAEPSRFGAQSAVAASADGRVMVTGNTYGDLTVRAPPEPRPIARHERVCGGVHSIALDRDARQILVASRNGRATIVDRQSGEVLRTFAGHLDGLLHAAFSPDERRIVTCAGDATIRVWDVATGAQLFIFRDHLANRVEFLSADRLVSAGADGSVRFWHLDGRALRKIVEAVEVGRLTDAERRSQGLRR